MRWAEPPVLQAICSRNEGANSEDCRKYLLPELQHALKVAVDVVLLIDLSTLDQRKRRQVNYQMNESHPVNRMALVR